MFIYTKYDFLRFMIIYELMPDSHNNIASQYPILYYI